MAVREVRKEGEDILRKKSKSVRMINDRIITLLDDMAETMEIAEGVGMAAVQVGVLKRIFIADLGGEIIEFINPEIIETEGSQVTREGCLSVPGQSGFVERPNYVKMTAINRNGEEFEIEVEEYLATVVCHEYDHLDGILYTDKLTDPPEGYELENDEDDE